MASLASIGQGLKDRFLVSLQYPEFRKLWVTTMMSQSSSWALIVARAALVLELTGSPAWTGAVTFAAMIPALLVSPIAGFLADKFDRRTVLACAISINVGTNVVLAMLVVTGIVEAWHVLLLSIVNGSARSSQMPSAQALLVNMVPRDQVLNAVSLYQATVNGSRFLGPVLILVLLKITGVLGVAYPLWGLENSDNWVFFLCVGMYGIAFTMCVSIRTRSRGVLKEGNFAQTFFSNFAAGISYMYRNPVMLSLVLLVVAHCGMTMSFESLFPLVARDTLGLITSKSVLGGFSQMMVGFGIAALIASLMLAGVRDDALRGKLLLWLGVLSGISPVALVVLPNIWPTIWVAFLATAIMGFAQGGFMTLSHAMLQTLAPDAIRGRVLGVYTWHTTGMMASFNFVNGSLAALPIVGALPIPAAPVILGAGGLGFLMVMILSFARIPLRELYARGVPAPSS